MFLTGRGVSFASKTLTIALALAAPAHALDRQKSISQYGHTAWRVREGHFSGPPTAVTQTKDGYLWIGTEAGLIRFDGVRFAPWKPPEGTPLPDDRIVALSGAGDGSLWIGTATGLAQWKEGKLLVHAKAGRFSALLEDRQGIVWAGHTRALSQVPPLCRMARNEFRCFGASDELPLRYVGALYEDREGNLWIGGDDGVCRWRPDGPDCHDIPSLARLRDKSGVFAIAEDSEGYLWASAGPTGIWRFSSGGWKRNPHEPDPDLESEAMLSDREGALWVGTLSAGLLRNAQGRWERFTRADGLSGDAVTDVFEDREGNVWVTTTSGLDRFRDVKVATWTQREGLLGGRAMSVTASRDGGVWIAENRALVHLKEGKLTFYRTGQGLPGKSPASLFEDSRGRLWLGVDTSLVRRERDRFVRIAMPDGSDVGVVRAMVEDRDGDLWVSTTHPGRALLRVRKDRVVEVLPVDELGGRQIGAMVADPSGGVWLGLDRLGLRLYRNGTSESYGLAGDLSGASLRSLFLDSRGLWAATNRGLGRFRDGKLDTLDTRNGLPCDDVEATVTSDDGSLWVKTVCGLVQIAPRELDSWSEHPESRIEVRVLDAFDGAQAGLTPFTPRSAKSVDGRLWFAIEGGGLQVIDPDRVKDNRAPPPVWLLRVIADRKTYEPDARMQLPPLTRDLEIDYTALSLTVPEKVRFRYRLEGADRDWHDAGSRREAFYTHLRPGDYQFRVIACNNDGVWNEEGAALEFTIPPAFHQTSNFILLCVAATACIAWMAYRWRLGRVMRRLDLQFNERLAERTRIAQDLHDTLLQGFLSASMQLHVADDRLSADSPAKPLVGRVLQLMGQVIEEGRNAVRGLRSSDGDSDNLEQAFSRVPQELGVQEPIGFRVIVEGQPRPLHPLIRDEVYRIGREALVNAFRHARARSIELQLEYGVDRLRIVVRDDGAGIAPDVLKSQRDGHWGLTGMHERAERIGAKLKVWSRAAAGTEVALAVPGQIAFPSQPMERLRPRKSAVPGLETETRVK